MDWLGQTYPELVGEYRRLYRRGAYLPPEYRHELGTRVSPLLTEHRLARGPQRSAPARAVPAPVVAAQQTLF